MAPEQLRPQHRCLLPHLDWLLYGALKRELVGEPVKRERRDLDNLGLRGWKWDLH